MTKRTNIFLLGTSLLIALGVFIFFLTESNKIIHSIETIMILVYFIIVVISVIVVYKSIKKKPIELATKYLNLIEKKDFQSTEKILIEFIDRSYILRNVTLARAFLFITYLKQDKMENAKNIIEKHKNIKKMWIVLYPCVLIALYENNLFEAKSNYKYWINFKGKIKDVSFNEMLDLAERAIRIVETKTYDDYFYNKTSYPKIREICLSFKKANKKLSESFTEEV